jgi:hypothetical protein
MSQDGSQMVDVQIPADADLMVFQRVSHRHIAQAIKLIRAKGVAVVVELDDDLSCIDPRNPAFELLQPGGKGAHGEHSWHNLMDACRDATMVVTSTPALQRRFASHGRGAVFENYIHARLLQIPRVDHDVIGWAGSVHSHPGDLQVMGSSANRLAQGGAEFMNIGNGIGVKEAWSLPEGTPLHCSGVTDVFEWPDYVAKLGIGVAPLADTKFNAAKSWLKMAEMAAVGVPCVVSPRAEYMRLFREGIGMAVEKPNQWYNALNRLRTDVPLREDMSAAGRAIMGGYTIEGNAWKLAEIWADAVALQRTGRVR